MLTSSCGSQYMTLTVLICETLLHVMDPDCSGIESTLQTKPRRDPDIYTSNGTITTMSRVLQAIGTTSGTDSKSFAQVCLPSQVHAECLVYASVTIAELGSLGLSVPNGQCAVETAFSNPFRAARCVNHLRLKLSSR